MLEGRIMKALSGFYYVKTEDGTYACKGRGVFRNKKITPFVGDMVRLRKSGDKEGYITEVFPRRNKFVRPPIVNVTQAIIVNAVVQPSFSTLLLDRFLVINEMKRIKPLIVVTKKDLATEEDIERMKQYKKDYAQLGYEMFLVSLEDAATVIPIKEHFKNEITVLMGQSGVGKSTLLNTIDQRFSIETGEISLSLGRGKHTTRHVELHETSGGLVGDTPGFSSIEFDDIEAEQLASGYVEIKKQAQSCKFRSCLHAKEPKCAVKEAVEAGTIKQYRYDHYIQFLQEINQRKPRY